MPKGIPRTEKVWERINLKGSQTYYITSKGDRATYYIYRVDDDKAVKLGQNKDPTLLKKKYIKEWGE